MPPPHPTDAEAGPEQVAPTEAVPLAAAAPAPVKKKRNLPGTPGLSLSLCVRARRGCFGVGGRACVLRLLLLLLPPRPRALTVWLLGRRRPQIRTPR
jgi:hypothetical protein